MKLYIDTGIFIDYLSKQALGGASLRTAPRNGRSPEKLYQDANKLLRSLIAPHTAATSCLTLYEVEEALHKNWEAEAKGVANASALRVLAARSIMPQAAMAMELFGVERLPLTSEIVYQQLNHRALHVGGVRAADALHVTTASVFGADMIVSADEDVLQLDGKVVNCNGTMMLCVDSNAALLRL